MNYVLEASEKLPGCPARLYFSFSTWSTLYLASRTSGQLFRAFQKTSLNIFITLTICPLVIVVSNSNLINNLNNNPLFFTQVINTTTAWLAGIFGVLALGLAILFGRNYCTLRKVSAEKERLQAELKAIVLLVGMQNKQYDV